MEASRAIAFGAGTTRQARYQARMSIDSFLKPVGTSDGPFELPGAQDWMQGRTLYGGASALVAYIAATRALPQLPPLRAAQVGFVAPVGETVETRVVVLREGRNVTQVRSELLVDGDVGLTALFLFGAARDANALHPAPQVEDMPVAPEEAEEPSIEGAPAFIRNNFEIRRAHGKSGRDAPVMRRWVRLTGRDTLDPVARLVLLGDTLPPGAVRAMRRRGPMSSINWSFNVLDTSPVTRDGWWLAETAADHADDGFSSERLRMWNADGKQVLTGMQAAAIFG